MDPDEIGGMVHPNAKRPESTGARSRRSSQASHVAPVAQDVQVLVTEPRFADPKGLRASRGRRTPAPIARILDVDRCCPE
ncbi:hypothetical protein [Sphingosinicella sp. BN140058]|uniref:hypothetical protein n=1 Tax=Sphingosinicella sp. BN140058 TaxID=1892855 RepID=UPI001011AB3D|nr:hypothetical protein [Sphingosinicella sp. BN140058]QAY77441.1 hypothetical protein ETR14_13690 [Sphingosinicella sp. BN140058]